MPDNDKWHNGFFVYDRYVLQAQQQANTTVVVAQPRSTIYRQDVPTWVGSDGLIYLSVFTMLCCGLLPGMIALALAWEVSRTLLFTLFASEPFD